MKLDDKAITENHSVDNEATDTAEYLNDVSEADDGLIKMPKATYSYSLICLIIIAVVAAVYVIAINSNSAYTTVSASFSEIADGHNPDGSPFEIYEVLSDEVLKSACDKLDNKVDPETLKKHISVTGITTDGTFNTIRQKVLDGNDTYSYFPSRYTITYSIVSDSIAADGVFASIAAVFKQLAMPSKTKILQCVADSYKEYYENNYVLTSEVFDIDWSKTKSLDYFNRASEINNILNRISRYLGKRYDEDVEFVSKDGVSFGDLKDEAAGIMQNDIESYKSFVIQNGITSDRDKLLKQFRYVLNTNNDQAVRSRGEYAIMLDGISIYDPSITKVVFIPALDSENVFYMNRTKIGIDYLTEDASKANLAGDEAENNAHYYEYLISQFGNVTNSEDWILKAADKRCEEIISKVNDFCERAVAVNDEYISSVSYEGVEISSISYGQGLISSAVAIAKITVIWASVLYVLWLACSVLQKKKRAWKEGKYTDVNS
ncbi:MAG: hypothetical protein SOS24_01325 [Clostridia bacterium]|nr:hypothetical protein [Clostridia bacterium]